MIDNERTTTRVKVAQYLRSELENRRRQNYNYNKTEFAQDLSLNNATLTKLLAGTGDMTLETKIGIAIGLRSTKIFDLAGYDGLAKINARLLVLSADMTEDQARLVDEKLNEIQRDVSSKKPVQARILA